MSVAPIRTLKRHRGGGSFEQEFTFTGSVQSVTIPSKGLYKLEVWGAQGSDTYYTSGKGGYSVGYALLNRNAVLYVAVGGKGNAFNGGCVNQTTNPYASNIMYGGGGGGATHIAKVDGQLSAIGHTSFVTNGNGLIVAGGGGGGSRYYRPSDQLPDRYIAGNSGGGLSGGGSRGGTQSGGYAFGQGQNTGVGGYGGGGLYGGYIEASDNGAGGGSGYIGGVPEITYKGNTYTPSTTNGVQGGNGKAKITKIV